jgi:hypothetical protein
MRWKKKITTIKTSTTKKARQAYGPEAIDYTDDVSQSDLDQLQQSFSAFFNLYSSIVVSS